MTARRRTLTTLQRAAFFLERGGRCEAPDCRRKIGTEAWDIDHIVPVANGGSNDDDNLQLLCASCHKRKTAKDVRTIRKGNRVRANHLGARRSRNPMLGSRHHPSKLRKRMDGRVERWD